MANSHRRAYTLIEMLAVMTIASIVLGVILLVLSTLIKRNSDTDLRIARAVNLENLCKTIRAKAHSATSLKLDQAGSSLELTHINPASQSTIHFRNNPFRVELNAENANQKQILGLSGFRQGKFSQITLPNAFTPLLVLELWPDPPKKNSTGIPIANHPIRMEFAIGTDNPTNDQTKN